MTMRSRPQLRGVALAGAALTATLVGTRPGPPRHGGGKADLPDRIALPDGFQPEGIAIDRGLAAYLGSRANGDIYAVDLRTGSGPGHQPGPPAPSVGLKVDRQGCIYVSGGTAGTARVVDARTGALLADYRLAHGAGDFVNDVVLTKRTAWFTDSRTAAALQRGPEGRPGSGARPHRPARATGCRRRPTTAPTGSCRARTAARCSW